MEKQERKTAAEETRRRRSMATRRRQASLKIQGRRRSLSREPARSILEPLREDGKAGGGERMGSATPGEEAPLPCACSEP